MRVKPLQDCLFPDPLGISEARSDLNITREVVPWKKRLYGGLTLSSFILYWLDR